MAKVNKAGARLLRAEGWPSAFIHEERSGLTFSFRIEDHIITLTHVERDAIIARWTELERKWQND